MNQILTLQNVSAGYEGKAVIEGVNLSIHSDDFIGIVGPNGGGKTTLLKIILGLMPPLQGRVIYPNKKKPSIGYLPQESHTDTRFPIKVEEVILSGLYAASSSLFNFSRKKKLLVNECISLLHLQEVRHKLIGELSGGQLQRTLLGRAIISHPELLVLDEPDTYMDREHESQLYDLLRTLNQQLPILIVSHKLNTCLAQVKTIACVNKGVHYHPIEALSFDLLEQYGCSMAGLSKKV